MRLYSTDHEWIELEGDIGTVGITRHAAETLGEIVFLEVKPSGTGLATGGTAAVVESVKAASDIFTPAAGEITEVNSKVVAEPALLNESPEDKGWLFKIRLSNTAELKDLMNEEKYKAFCVS